MHGAGRATLELQLVCDFGHQAAEGQGGASLAPEEHPVQPPQPLQPADLHLEAAEVLTGALPVGAGEDEGLRLAAAAVGRVRGLAEGGQNGLGGAGAGQLHIPGKSEQPGFCFLLMPR